MKFPNVFKGNVSGPIGSLFVLGAFMCLGRLVWLNARLESVAPSDLEPAPVVIEDVAQAMTPAEKEWLRPWSQRRGIESIDSHNEVVLVKADIEPVSQLLSPSFRSWQPNILSQDVLVTENYLFSFQLQGHPWTELLSLNYATPILAQFLSDKLQTAAFDYSVNDTSASDEYFYFEQGVLQAQMTRQEDELITCFILDSPEKGSRSPSEPPCDLGELVRELDLFEPGISVDYFWDDAPPARGDRRTVQNPGFTWVSEGNRHLKTTPIFKRVDYLAN